MKSYPKFFIIVLICLSVSSYSQDIALWQQFNGRFDFIFVGNTLNDSENNSNKNCVINTSSSATLTLNSADKIEKAYLYWAGSGSGDFDVKLNNTAITAQRKFKISKNYNPDIILDYFSSFADVTDLVKATGNENYTLSDLDLNPVITDSPYCQNRTNFGGWALVIIYQNDNLPLNQVNVYDGLQGIPDSIDIKLNSLNVIDNEGAKIGFVAWEGDSSLSVNETLRINGNILSNALNPSNNAFNGTDTFTNSTLYNMDLDVYDIQNNINIGDSSAMIQLTSGQDFVMINTIITKLNSQLPDATVSIDKVLKQCNSKTINVDYTIYNLNSTEILPANVPVAIYANDIFIQTTNTLGAIPIGESQSNSISLLIPDQIPNDFSLRFVVDSNANGIGTVTETNENNNDFTFRVIIPVSPAFNVPPNLDSCNEGFEKGTFNFSNHDQLIKINQTDVVTYFNNETDALANVNPIANTAAFTTTKTPTEIFVRVENSDHCFSITSFLLIVKNCPPVIYNFVDATTDGPNDIFHIEGLRNVFLNFKLTIFNRWGTLVWTGNHNTEDWDGMCNASNCLGGNQLPGGTYFYVLDLNDPNYTKGMAGYVHLNR